MKSFPFPSFEFKFCVKKKSAYDYVSEIALTYVP